MGWGSVGISFTRLSSSAVLEESDDGGAHVAAGVSKIKLVPDI